jgi:hypothetical protein
MSDKIHVQRVSPSGTAEWRAVRSDGSPLFEIRLQLSSMLNGSRYFVISPRGDVVRHGTFNFDAWDSSAIVQVLSAIVAAVSPGSEVDVEVEAPRRASAT